MEQLQPGQMLGVYRITGQIGQGGMATVYKAYHAAMDREVAIKVLPGQLAQTTEFVGRFRQEARTIANLEHGRILPVYDFGESKGIFYLVMRYLNAGTLKERLHNGPLILAQIDRWFTQLAEALEYAHKRGVIHRDLKPSNVLVDSQGDLYLTDFGIAKLLEADPQFTATGAMVGTPAYISPEQAQGEPIDQRSDIYSLGIILYEMVTGRVPYEADTPLAVVLKQISAPLPLPTSLKPDLSPAIERVLLKALTKEPTDRFATVGDFLTAWKEALVEAERPKVPAVVPDAAEKPAASATKRPVGLILGGAAGLLLLLLIAGLVLGRIRNRREQRAEPQLPPPGAAGEVEAATPAAAEAENNLSAQPAYDTFVWQSWSAANNVRTLQIKDDKLYAAGPGGLTVWNLADGQVLRRYTTGDGLPHANVTAIWVDDEGTIWAGTEAGLGRLDPDDEVWTVYSTDDGLDSELVSAVARIEDFLIVGTQYSGQDGGGLNLFDGESWQTMPDFPSTDSERALDEGKIGNKVNVIFPEAPDDVIWIGTEAGLGRYDPDGEDWTIYSTADGLPDDHIYALYLDPEGDLLVGTAAGAARFDGETFAPTDQAPPYGVYGIVSDEQDRLYFSGSGGIWRFDPDKADWEEFSQQTGAVTIYNLTAAAEIDGVLFFGSDGAGIWRYEDEEFTSWYIDDSPVRTAFGKIMAPAADELWFVEEYGSYIDHYNLGARAWAPYAEHPCGCEPMALDTEGNVWGGRWQEGFVIATPGGDLTQVSVDQGLPADYNVRTIAPLADGTAWIGLQEHGLARYEDEHITEILTAESAGFASDFVRTLFVAADGSLWVGVDGGLSHLLPDGEWEHFNQGEVFAESFGGATDFAEDDQGNLWLATASAGVYRLTAGEWTNYSGGQSGVSLPTADVNAVTVGPDGLVWFGTDNGVANFDGERWAAYKVKDGLINNKVNDIYIEPDGTIWFATRGGVARWGP